MSKKNAHHPRGVISYPLTSKHEVHEEGIEGPLSELNGLSEDKKSQLKVCYSQAVENERVPPGDDITRSSLSSFERTISKSPKESIVTGGLLNPAASLRNNNSSLNSTVTLYGGPKSSEDLVAGEHSSFVPDSRINTNSLASTASTHGGRRRTTHSNSGSGRRFGSKYPHCHQPHFHQDQSNRRFPHNQNGPSNLPSCLITRAEIRHQNHGRQTDQASKGAGGSYSSSSTNNFTMSMRSFFLCFIALFLLISSSCTAELERKKSLSFGVHSLRRPEGTTDSGEPHAVRIARFVRKQRKDRSGSCS